MSCGLLSFGCVAFFSFPCEAKKMLVERSKCSREEKRKRTKENKRSVRFSITCTIAVHAFGVYICLFLDCGEIIKREEEGKKTG